LDFSSITRQDSGKNLHDVHPTQTFVDLNRSGMPLLEIVSRPDLRSTEEVVAYVRKLAGLLRHLHICQADMSKSQVSVHICYRFMNFELSLSWSFLLGVALC
jgi:aspartyl-tRNA(Asn)/glutamyl-tRNA(Gln) amidotransferase subunit B